MSCANFLARQGLRLLVVGVGEHIIIFCLEVGMRQSNVRARRDGSFPARDPGFMAAAKKPEHRVLA